MEKNEPSAQNEIQVTPPVLVAICGLAGSGKSTCAEFLVREWGYTNIKFASPIKEMLRALGLNDNHLEGGLKEIPTALLAGQSPRHAMQTLGTEWGREQMGLDFWVDIWRLSAAKIIGEGGKVVVDDCRFPNELRAIRFLNGQAVTIQRPVERKPVLPHRSETTPSNTDFVITNDGGRAHLLQQLCSTLGLNCQ
jgi:hypothetical protein